VTIRVGDPVHSGDVPGTITRIVKRPAQGPAVRQRVFVRWWMPGDNLTPVDFDEPESRI
jgi:hypothetical protein